MQNNRLKKSYVWLIIILFISTSTIPSITSKSIKNITFYPDFNPQGNILYVGGNGPNNYTNIQDAINDAFDGDTIFVFGRLSPYNEEITINKSINLIGENKETTIITGQEVGTLINIISDNVKISGFRLDAFYDVNTGIEINSNNNTIFDVNITDPTYAIIIRGINNTVKNSVFWAGLNGLYLKNTKNNTIINCSFYYYNTNLLLEDSHNNKIINCHSEEFYSGMDVNIPAVELIHSSKNEFINHSFYRCLICFKLNNSNNNTINNCNLNYTYYGIILSSNSNDNLIKNNTFELCYFVGITDNWQDEFTTSNLPCNNNTFYYNHFYENNQHACDIYKNNWDNGSIGNYWSDYTGLDENNDGIGDTPYNISCGNNQDRYPIIEKDEDKPSIKITRPENGLYINNKKIRDLKSSIVIGKINIIAEVSDKSTIVDRVEFYIDNGSKPVYVNNTCSSGEVHWEWSLKTIDILKKPLKSNYKIKAVAYDREGNSNSDEINIKRLYPVAVICSSIAALILTLTVLKLTKDSM